LESAPFLRQIAVKGEISNLTRHSSGHYYFSLKDADAQIGCVMFRAQAAGLTVEPEAGDQVTATADISVYLPRGNYQLLVTELQKEGQGDLYARFLQLKARLEAEGLFDPARKKAIPRFPQKIGVVSSPTGAVIRDIQNTLSRRYPAIQLLLAPSRVQGAEAVPELIAALKMLDARPDVDLIILARGGGSIEDLWCFNDEQLARTLSKLKKPVISAIGHETDFTIADFVADLRAPTPTAAAELSVPDRTELLAQLDDLGQRMAKSLRSVVWSYAQYVDELQDKAAVGLRQQLRLRRQQLESQEQRLKALDYRSVLRRGFSITTIAGQRLTTVKQVKAGAPLTTWLADGAIESEVKKP
jgi:exodeoxyribonuclease VII large subunit